MKCVLRMIVVGALGFAAAPLVRADVVHLKDGTRIEGDVKRRDDGWAVSSKGKTTLVRPENVQSIELTPTTAAAPQIAAERLASLRRSVENLADLREIIARYQRFIEQTKDPVASEHAKKELTDWQERLEAKQMKVGNRWVAASEREKLLDEAAALADQARQLMKQGRFKEAEPLLHQAAADDPRNVSALYLIALLRCQQEQWAPARKALDTVARLVPDHAPTMNNLAVVQWRQRQYVAALMSFDGAMLALPGNKDILDNVASALQFLPQEFRNGPVALRVSRRFAEQDKQLAEQMAQAGWHRYGATWMSDKDAEEIRRQEKETLDKLDAMAVDFDKGKARVDDLNRRIADVEEQLHSIEARSYVREAGTGAFLRIPYPTVYYDLQRDASRLIEDRAREAARLDALQVSAKNLQKRLQAAAGKAIDVQRMIGPEGTPLGIAQLPATRPATTQAQPQPEMQPAAQ